MKTITLSTIAAVLIVTGFTGCDSKKGENNVVTAPTVLPLTDANGTEPWVSDGTTAGTRMLKDINPGPADSVPEKIGGNDHNRKFVPVGDITFFPARVYHERNVADKSIALREGETTISLWKSDGTPEGTVMLHDFNYSIGDDNGLAQLVVMNGKLYFRGYDLEHGHQIWSSDGTIEGTKRVTDLDGTIYDLNTIGGLRSVQSFISFHVKNLATGNWEIRKSDGTSADTDLIKSEDRGEGREWYAFKSIDGKLYFRGYDDTHGFEPWVSDGTVDGTHIVDDIFSGESSSDPTCFVKAGSMIYFAADANETHRCLYGYKSSENTTLPLACARRTGAWTVFYPMKSFNDRLYFRMVVDDNNRTLWVSDGTVNGTHKVFGDEYNDLNPKPIIPVGDRLFFPGTDKSTLYVWDGNAQEPTPLTRERNITGIHNFRVVGNELWFLADEENNCYGLWRTDGTMEGTVQIKEFCENEK